MTAAIKHLYEFAIWTRGPGLPIGHQVGANLSRVSYGHGAGAEPQIAAAQGQLLEREGLQGRVQVLHFSRS